MVDKAMFLWLHKLILIQRQCLVIPHKYYFPFLSAVILVSAISFGGKAGEETKGI